MHTGDLHAKILTFLRGELALTGHQVLVALELELAPVTNGFRPQQLKKWVREAQPELFDGGVETEKLVSTIIQMADDDVETQSPGKYRYVVRTHQRLGERSTCSFSLSPTYRGGHEDNDSTSIMTSAGAKIDATAATTMVLGKHAGDLMRVNLQMFDVQAKYAGQVTSKLLEENAELHLENRNLRRENDELKSTRMEREYDLSERAEKMHQGNKQFDKIMQLGTIVASKVLGDGGMGSTTPVGMLLHTFKESLTQEQTMRIAMTLTNEQRLMLGEIMSYASTGEQAQGQPPNGHGNGVANGQAKP